MVGGGMDEGIVGASRVPEFVRRKFGARLAVELDDRRPSVGGRLLVVDVHYGAVAEHGAGHAVLVAALYDAADWPPEVEQPSDVLRLLLLRDVLDVPVHLRGKALHAVQLALIHLYAAVEKRQNDLHGGYYTKTVFLNGMIFFSGIELQVLPFLI